MFKGSFDALSHYDDLENALQISNEFLETDKGGHTIQPVYKGDLQWLILMVSSRNVTRGPKQY